MVLGSLGTWEGSSDAIPLRFNRLPLASVWATDWVGKRENRELGQEGKQRSGRERGPAWEQQGSGEVVGFWRYPEGGAKGICRSVVYGL